MKDVFITIIFRAAAIACSQNAKSDVSLQFQLNLCSCLSVMNIMAWENSLEVLSMRNMTNKEYKSPLLLIGEGESFKDELCSMIESARMFSEFSRPEVQIIAGYAHAYEVAPGDTIFREGEKGQFMCLIVEGRVNVLKDDGKGHRKAITVVRAGQTMGEMSLLDDLPSSATATAKELTKLVLITRNNFEHLTEDHPALGVRILKKIARLMSLRLRQTTGVLLDHLA